MTEVCAEEGVSQNSFFLFSFSFDVVFILMAILEKNINKIAEDLKKQLMKTVGAT